ncbi:MAG: hypothetical protein JWM73_1519 [Solirubrobacterales bacterium]|nr:hypothetical protein [Solirubrobacterales bacterium]
MSTARLDARTRMVRFVRIRLSAAVLLSALALLLAGGSPATAAAASAGSGCAAFGPGVSPVSTACFGGRDITVSDDACHARMQIIRGVDASCGVIALENIAYETYAGAHGFALDDPRIKEAGGEEIAGILWGLFKTLADDAKKGDPALSGSELEAYQWLQTLIRAYNVYGAQFAIDEYDEWNNAPCSYVPPNPDVFDFRGVVDAACSATFASTLRRPSPPTKEEFLSYGLYDESQYAQLLSAASTPWSDALMRDAVTRYSGAWLMLSGLGPAGISGFIPALNTKFERFIHPHQKKGDYLEKQRLQKVENKVNQGVEKTTAKETGLVEENVLDPEINSAKSLQALRNAGIPIEEDVAPLLEKGLVDTIKNAGVKLVQKGVQQAGISVARALTTAARGLASSAGVGFTVVGIAASIAEAEGEEVVRAEKLRGELVDYRNEQQNTAPVIQDILDQDGGATYVQGILMSLYEPAAFKTGVAKIASTEPAGLVTPPYHGDQWQFSYVNDDGIARYTQRVPVLRLRSWPVGVGMGVDGVPFPYFALDNGMIYRSSLPDEEKAGGKGYYPTTSLEYFGWNNRPRIAWLRGDKFIDMPSPGSADMGGFDDSPICQDTAGCRETNVLFAMDAGGNRIRVSAKPNVGTPAVVGIDNLLGGTAGTDLFGLGSGLVVGQTVQLVDPMVNTNGLDTTYTWQIETRCAHGATCTNSADPAFHGNPVTTLTGQKVRFTWPSAGAFHVRLTTEDAYGVKHVNDQDVTVVDADPRFEFGTTPPLQYSAFGPIKPGDTASITGCVLMPADQYTEPTMTLDWGDGAQATQTGEGTSNQLAVTFGAPGGGCASHWRFTAVHDYNVTATLQRKVAITVADGLGRSRAVNVGANLVYSAPAAFVPSSSSATFTAGSFGSYRASTTGAPTATVTLSGDSLPPGLGFQPFSDGTATISGDANINNGGIYNVNLHADNGLGTANHALTLTVLSTPRITSSASAGVAVGTPASLPLTAVGFPAPTVSVQGSLPPGLSFGSGSITGTPDPGTAGDYNLVVRAVSTAGVAQQAYHLTVAKGPAITSPNTAPFIKGHAPSSFTITASGFPAPGIAMTGTLPAGLSFHDNGDGTAAIFGSADAGASSTTVGIDATNSAGTDHQNLTVNASPTGGPTVTVGTGGFPEPRFQIGSANTYTVTSSDTAATLTADGALPSGVQFTDNHDGTATIAGTPDPGTGGYYSLVIKAAHAGNPDGIAFAQVQVFGPPTVTSAGIAHFTVGSPGTFAVTTSGLPRADVLKTGALPGGLTFTDNSDGTATISGTPGAGTAGSYPITLRAENIENLGSPATSPLTVEVDQPPLITSSGAVNLASGQPGSFAVTTSGHPAPALTLTGSLPIGLMFTDNGDGTGKIEGTPLDLTPATYPLSLQASSPAGTTSQGVTLIVAPALSFTSDDAAAFVRNAAGTFTITTTGSPTGTAATTIAAEDPLPDGLLLTDNGDGTATLDGTPTGDADGTVVTIAATNGFGTTRQELTVSVGAPPAFPGGTSRDFKSGNRGGSNSWALETTGFPRPALTLTGALPDGVTFSDNGDGTATIEGQPVDGSAGAYPLTLHMDNVHGSTTADLTLNVTATAIFTSPRELTWVAGIPQTFTVTTDGAPAAAEISIFGGQPPSWVTFSQTDAQKAQGVATLHGAPPLDALGYDGQLGLHSDNGVPNGDVLPLHIQVAPVGFTAVAPPAGTLGSTYTYTFGAVGAGAGPVDYTVADGDFLPPGLTLSPGGVLSGQPEGVGTWVFHVVATSAGGSATTSVEISVAAAERTVLISAFRLFGLAGMSDWYAEVTNATSQPLVLDGWQLRLPVRSGGTGTTDLGDGTLAPGASRLISGPFLSRRALGKPDVVGPPTAAFPGGMQVVAPDGTVTDRVGESGAPAGYFAGTPLPTEPILPRQGAYERRTSGWFMANTGDNRKDFKWVADPVVTRVVRSVGTAAGHVVVGENRTRIALRWPKNAFSAGTLLTVHAFKAPGIMRGTSAVRISAMRRGQRVKHFWTPVDLAFATSPAKAKPAFASGKRWLSVKHLRRTHLPKGSKRGWYRGKSGRIHVLTRWPGLYGLAHK